MQQWREQTPRDEESNEISDFASRNSRALPARSKTATYLRSDQQHSYALAYTQSEFKQQTIYQTSKVPLPRPHQLFVFHLPRPQALERNRFIPCNGSSSLLNVRRGRFELAGVDESS